MQSSVPPRPFGQHDCSHVLRTEELPVSPHAAQVLQHQQCQDGWLLLRLVHKRRATPLVAIVSFQNLLQS